MGPQVMGRRLGDIECINILECICVVNLVLYKVSKYNQYHFYCITSLQLF